MNKQQLANKIWASANKMRSNIEASEYKDYILGFIFYKFLSEQEEEYLYKGGMKKEDLKTMLVESDADVVRYCKENKGYFISYDNLFSTWHKIGKDFNIQKVKDALNAFSRHIDSGHKTVFEDIFATLDIGISKLGNNAQAQTKAVRNLIDLINDIPMDGKQDYDVLGFIYEYLISNFAANAGKKAGEFYTPHEVSLLMSEIVAYHSIDKEEIQIYDPTSGSGSLLINIGKCVTKHMNNANKVKYYAQELIKSTYNLTRMNLVMRGILPSNIVTRCGDSLDKDWPFFDDYNNYEPLYVDAVVSNPPYSQNWEPDAHVGDIRFSGFGYAPKSRADYAFLLHGLYHLKPNGIMTIVLPHGVLFRGNEEEQIRKNLIENNHIDTIIGLPKDIFFGTGIPTVIIVLKKSRSVNDVLIIDASKYFIKDGKNNKLQKSDIKRIVDTYIERKDKPKFAKVVSKQEIQRNGYNLNIPRYVDSNEDPEQIDIYASMFGGIPYNEIDLLSMYWDLFPSLKGQLFASIENKPYAVLNTDDIANTIKSNIDIKKFVGLYNSRFVDFEEFLNNQLLIDLDKIPINKLDTNIVNNIFARINDMPIVDKYYLYQEISDVYAIIAQDLETIQIEGKECIIKVDPHMVLKKKGDEKVEVQDGWEGHILPFDLIEQIYFKSDLELLESKNNHLNDIKNRYDELFDGLDEEEKNIKVGSQSILNDKEDDFSSKGIKAYVKIISKEKDKFDEESIEHRLLEVDKMIKDKSLLTKEIKSLKTSLMNKTKEKIESLTYEECLTIFKFKWIKPILDSINKMTELLIENIIQKISLLSKKYDNTMIDISNNIKEAEKELSTMIDDLEGNEFDIKGLSELQKLLNGDENE